MTHGLPGKDRPFFANGVSSSGGLMFLLLLDDPRHFHGWVPHQVCFLQVTEASLDVLARKHVGFPIDLRISGVAQSNTSTFKTSYG